MMVTTAAGSGSGVNTMMMPPPFDDGDNNSNHDLRAEWTAVARFINQPYVRGTIHSVYVHTTRGGGTL